MAKKKTLAKKRSTNKQPSGTPNRLAEAVDLEPPPRLPFPVVGIGASAGGLEAFLDFFKAMKADSGMAFVLIQHLPPDRESLIAEILAKCTQMPVSEIKDGVAVRRNHVYVIRPGRTVTIKKGKLHLAASVGKPGHGRPVDDFFRSLAEEQRERAICVIMSGMGSNGTAGAQTVKAVGGLCIAQDPLSAKFPSMPRSFIESGLADFVLKPAEIPEALLRYGTHPYARGIHFGREKENHQTESLLEILSILRTRTQHDFSGYKHATVTRRIQRRMGLAQLVSMSDYARLLRQAPHEATTLSDDMMIHVTGFFRDPEVWESLRTKVLVPLIAERASHTPIRAWVAACSSGEEAYTLAMLLVETADAAGKNFDIKIFATDTAERSLHQARASLFPGGIESEISAERLSRFFEREDASYRVKKQLRELVVFAPQNLLQDPPFSRLDICSCRNLLIYLKNEAQQRALALLHFGLRENGTLLLGNSETISGADDYFEPIDKKHRLFRRVGATHHGAIDFSAPRHASASTMGSEENPEEKISRANVAQLSRKVLLERFSPAAVVVDRQHHILYFHGPTDRYLDQPRGEPTRDLIALVREPLRAMVRGAMHRAMTKNETRTTRQRASAIGTIARVEVTVIPLDRAPEPAFFLLVFTEGPEAIPTNLPKIRETPSSRKQLLDDLNQVRDELQSTIEELQTSSEEMKAAHEETISVNEELQSTNEELETSKEELQSLNEELTTVNTQLQAKMEDLEGTTNDLSSLLSSTDIAVVFLDTQLRIRRFTPAVKDLLQLIPSDMGRPLSDLARKFVDPHLLNDVREVLEKLVPIEAEVTSESGRSYLRRALPYRTIDNHIDGIVLTFIDFTRRKEAEIALRTSEEKHRLILNGVVEYAIVMLDQKGCFATWTPGAQRILGYNATEALGRSAALISVSQEGEEKLQANLVAAKAKGSISMENWYQRKDGTLFWGSCMLSALDDDASGSRGYVKVVRDNTERKRSEEALERAKFEAEAANAAKDNFLANVSHELRTPLSAALLWVKLLNSQGDLEPAQLREGLDAIEQSAKEQQALIEDLMDTSRIIAGKLRLEIKEVDLGPLLRSTLENIRPAMIEKGLGFDYFIDPKIATVRADGLRLNQVMSNLLTNAEKFTPTGGRVTTRVERHQDIVEITVSDTGRGISTEFVSRIFERFTQAEQSESRQTGGMGLGLSICRQLVELHGGTITVASEGLAKGTSFTVRLPLPAISQNKIGVNVRSSKGSDLRGLRILLVEDAKETRRALAAVLTDAHATVVAVDSAQMALNEFNELRPDLILSDIGLGKVSGHELMRQLRQWEGAQKTPPVPAVALTAYADEKNRKEALASGFQEVLIKPVDGQLLTFTLAAVYAAR